MRNITEPIKIDPDDDNGIQLIPGDMDGLHLQEIQSGNKVYIYYSEIQSLITCLNEVIA